MIDLIFKFFDDQVTSILPEATMIHEKSEICVKFVAKLCWKTENSQEKMVVTTHLKNILSNWIFSPRVGVILFYWGFTTQMSREQCCATQRPPWGMGTVLLASPLRWSPAHGGARQCGDLHQTLVSCERWKMYRKQIFNKPNEKQATLWVVEMWVRDSTIQQTKPMRSSLPAMCVFVLLFARLFDVLVSTVSHENSLRIFQDARGYALLAKKTVCCLRSTCSSGPTRWTPQKFKAVPKVPGRSNTTHPRVTSWPSHQQKWRSKVAIWINISPDVSWQLKEDTSPWNPYSPYTWKKTRGFLPNFPPKKN